MVQHGTEPKKKASVQQVLDLQHEISSVFKNVPFDVAKELLSNKKQTRRWISDICKKLGIPTQSENILIQIPLLEKYYQEVYGITLDLSEVIFPDNSEFPAIMVDVLSQNEDEIMECKKNYFNKSGDPVNLYKYKDPVSENIDRGSEKLQLRKLQSGLVVFAHTGSDEPDDKHLKKSYDMAVAEKLLFAKYREYLRMTGFHKFINGYFMDKNGWTRTSSLWADGYLVRGYWGDDYSGLCAGDAGVGYSHPGSGPRQLFLDLP